MAEQPAARGILAAGIDYFGSKWLELPPEKCSYSSLPVQIPMKDGVELAADLYSPELPEGEAPAGLIMVQCCYGRDAGMSFLNARIFAARCFRALLVSTRGTYGSGGTFLPGRSEQSDSQDVVVWMRRQPWYPGTFATAGPSYLGYSQWAFLRDPPADCVAAAILVGPHDHALHAWGTGSFRLDRISWSDMMSRRDEKSTVLNSVSRIPGFKFLRPSLDETIAGLPLDASLEKHFEGKEKAPWIFDYLDHSNIEDEYWNAVRHHDAIERVNIPVLLVSGWYDTFTTQTLAQYRRLHERGIDVKLVVGPWTHVHASGLHSMPEVLDFFAQHLSKTGKYKKDPAHIYVTGAEEWHSLPVWPPATSPKTLYLQTNETISSEQPSQDARPLSFVFDPLSPTPALGGTQMADGGRVDDSAYAARSDVLTFTSEPLTEHVEIHGIPTVELKHFSDPPYADLFVRLSEVDTAGVSHNITQVYKALDPSRDASQTVRLALQDCAHQFRVGTRIRLIVAGGAFPMYARSLGTAEDRVRSAKVVSQKHTITVAAGLSQLALPVKTEA